MKLATLLAIAAPFLATDKKPEDLQRAIIAADKKAKDASGEGLGSRDLEEADQAKAQDAEMKREEAMDARESAMDERESAMDEGKTDNDAMDRKMGRDKRAKDRMDRKMGRDKMMKDRKMGRDRDDDPEHTNDEDYLEGANPSSPGGNRAGGSKTAVDSAEVDRRIAAAVSARDALHTARVEVEPIIGKVAYDSAGEVYRAALTHLKVDTKDIPDSALSAMLRLAKDRAAAQAPVIAHDAAAVSAMSAAIPGYGRLG